MEIQEKILVFYVNVGNLSECDVRIHIKQFAENVGEPIEGERRFFVAVRNQETRVECIYPQFIAEKSLIESSNAKLIELNQILDEHIKTLKTDEK